MSTTLSVRISDPIARRLSTIVSETDRSQDYHLQKALELYFEEMTDLQIAQRRLRSSVPEIEFDAVVRELSA